jgi:hypothetical protein
MPTVAIAIFSGVQALDVAGPVDVFSEANRFLAPQDHYEVTLLSAQPGPLRASNGMTLVADATFDQAHRPFDLALVAGGPALPDGAARFTFAGMAIARRRAVRAFWFGLHGRVRARPCRTARRAPCHDALAARGTTRRAVSASTCRFRPDLSARRQPGHIRGRDGRHRSVACISRGGPRPAHGARRRQTAGGLRPAARGPIAVQPVSDRPRR